MGVAVRAFQARSKARTHRRRIGLAVALSVISATMLIVGGGLSIVLLLTSSRLLEAVFTLP